MKTFLSFVSAFALSFLLFSGCDMAQIPLEEIVQQPGTQPDVPVLSNDPSFLSFVCEREEGYIFEPINNYLFTVPTVYKEHRSPDYEYTGFFHGVPLFKNKEPSTFQLKFYDEDNDDWLFNSLAYPLQITSTSYLKQFFYYFPELQIFSSESLALSETGDYSLDYSPRRTEEFTVPFKTDFRIQKYLYWITSQYSFNRTFTVTDNFKAVSRNFIRYRKLTLKYPDTVSIERVLEYPIVKEIFYDAHSLTVLMNDYDYYYKDNVCSLVLRTESGNYHFKTISIGL